VAYGLAHILRVQYGRSARQSPVIKTWNAQANDCPIAEASADLAYIDVRARRPIAGHAASRRRSLLAATAAPRLLRDAVTGMPGSLFDAFSRHTSSTISQ